MLICFAIFSRYWSWRPLCSPGGHFRAGGDSENALETLKKRYAKGEITKAEFDQMRKDILSKCSFDMKDPYYTLLPLKMF